MVNTAPLTTGRQRLQFYSYISIQYPAKTINRDYIKTGAYINILLCSFTLNNKNKAILGQFIVLTRTTWSLYSAERSRVNFARSQLTSTVLWVSDETYWRVH